MICLDFDWQINEFMVYCRSAQLREKSMKSYEQTLRLFERWCMEEMNKSLQRWLCYKDRYTSGKLLFSKKSGLPLDIHSFESGFKRYLGRAGIDKAYSPHALRNNFAKSKEERGQQGEIPLLCNITSCSGPEVVIY